MKKKKLKEARIVETSTADAMAIQQKEGYKYLYHGIDGQGEYWLLTDTERMQSSFLRLLNCSDKT